jgi:hypothetical protein
MKKILFIILISSLFLISSDHAYHRQSAYYPVLMERTELEKSVFSRDPQEIIKTGKIYYKDSFIFLNEMYKGIHVIDNSNPENPENIGFINIPGCIDIAIKSNSLLADNATDLVAVDLSNGLDRLTVTRRVRNVFPESTPPDLDFIPYEFNHSNRPENTIIVRWEPISPEL